MGTSKKKRAMSSDSARNVRKEGHNKARLFATKIGLNEDYQNNPQAKKDVIDKSGDAHSVKSGKWWQIFLYSRNRMDSDYIFQTMDGIGDIVIKILDVFPSKRKDYEKNKKFYKKKLGPLMVELKDKLCGNRLKSFLYKSIFNAGEVQYLTINPKDTNKFLVFYYEDVIDVLSIKLVVENSKARVADQYDDQKVIFKEKNNFKNVGEIEVRNDSEVHYREIKFRLNAEKITNILKENIKEVKDIGKNVRLYGKAIKKFKKPN
ncbi:MAG: hypothetical protein OXU73_01465 [Candidatus Campbellbacteria bacterium]|nr:hypothetical protein [Candidatus Campbellbacteria bacterium]